MRHDDPPAPPATPPQDLREILAAAPAAPPWDGALPLYFGVPHVAVVDEPPPGAEPAKDPA